MLTDVFAVGFASELLLQGGVELFIEALVALAVVFLRNGHLHLAIYFDRLRASVFAQYADVLEARIFKRQMKKAASR